MITFTFAVSAVMAMGGAVVHSDVSCNGKAMARKQLSLNLRFAYALVFWTFAAACFEAVAYRKEPVECAEDPVQTADLASTQDISHLAWQVWYPLLWVGWLTCVVAAAVLSKRIAPILMELNAAAEARRGRAVPQTV